MGCESALAFVTTGGSTSRGSLPKAEDTLSRTSLAALSRLVSRSNSTVMLAPPSRLLLVRFLMPAMPLILSSSGSVIWL